MTKSNQRLYLLGIFFVAVCMALTGYIAVDSQLQSYRTVPDTCNARIEAAARHTETITVAVDADCAPYVFTVDGAPVGRDVELIYALADQMGCNVDLSLSTRKDALSGDAEIVLCANHDSHLETDFAYSALSLSSDGLYFFGKSGMPVGQPYLLKIAAVEGSSATAYLSDFRFTNVVFFPTLTDAFLAVDNNMCDVLIANRTVGVATAARISSSLVPLGGELLATDYYLLVRTDSPNAQTRETSLNDALRVLKQNGTLAEINETWLTSYRPDMTLSLFWQNNYQGILLIGLICALLLSILGFLILQRRAVQKGKEYDVNPLTGQNTLQAFCYKVAAMRRKNPDKKFVIVRTDIDNFKLFNDTYGIAEGDRLLRELGRRLDLDLQSDKEKENLALTGYIGADHFVGCFSKYEFSPDKFYQYFRWLLQDIAPDYSFSVHLGFCEMRDKDGDVLQFCDRALLALKSVKNDYDVPYAWFNETMRQSLLNQSEITATMHRALANGEFVVYFQPQFNDVTGEMIGAESLVRWLHPTKGLISPHRFIPVFEKNGFIYELDKYVWQQACRHLRRFREEGCPLPHVSVNLSRRDIFHSDLSDVLTACVTECGLQPKDLRLEITESAYMQDKTRLISVMKDLKRLGFTIEMDDFGSGYSSLTALKDMPFDLVKLDMGFMNAAFSDDEDSTEKSGHILSGVVRLAHEINLPVIAEGVENRVQADFLRSIGCYYMQGYLFAKAMSAEAFSDFAKTYRVGTALDERFCRTENTGVDFMNVKNQDALLFNSFVGGACILELSDKDEITVLRANDKFYAEQGVSREDFAHDATDLINYLPPDSRETLLTLLRRSAEKKDEVEGTLLTVKNVWLRFLARRIAVQPTADLFYVAVKNITKTKTMTEHIRALSENLSHSADLYRSIIDESDAAVLVTDRTSMTVLFANVAAAAMFSSSKESLVGKPCYLACLGKTEACSECSAVLPPEGEVREEIRDGRRLIIRRRNIVWDEKNAVITYLSDVPAPKKAKKTKTAPAALHAEDAAPENK